MKTEASTRGISDVNKVTGHGITYRTEWGGRRAGKAFRKTNILIF